MESTKSSNGRERLQTRLLIAIGVFVLVILSWTGFIDRQSADYVDGALVQASVAFAVARTLNAVISVLQSIDVQLMVVGFSPGEILDPFNDMVEQFGSLMQLAVGSLILQKVLLVLVSDTFFKVTLTIVGGSLILSAFTARVAVTSALIKTFVFLAFLRFSVVLMVMLNGWVDNAFLEDQLRRDVSVLEGLPATIDIMNQETKAGVPSLEAMRDSGMADLAAKEADLQAKVAPIEAQLQSLLEQKALADAELTDFESKLSATERFNFMNRSPAHAAVIARVDGLDEGIETLNDELEALHAALARIDEERTALTDAKEGKPGFWNSVGDGLSSMVGKMAKLGGPDTYKELMSILNNMASTVVTVMTLFVLKTMILPLLFLYLFVQVFKRIWEIDLATVGRKSKPDTTRTVEQAHG